MATRGIGIADTGFRPRAGEEEKAHLIGDQQFIQDLRRLKELRSFLLQEAIGTADNRSLQFGPLNLLQYGVGGRQPTEEEWTAVECHTQALFGLLTEPLRRRFILGWIPAWVSYVPLVLALCALVSFVMSIFTLHNHLSGNLNWNVAVLPYYLVWLMCLGAIGSLAFIGMNALSVQQDVTFDLNNTKLMILRITLGALFGWVLTLPFGFAGYMHFIAAILGFQLPDPSAGRSGTSDALLLLLPFVLGFSTSLVIMIMNRLVDAIQSFFGKAVGRIPDEGSASATVTTPAPRKSTGETVRASVAP